MADRIDQIDAAFEELWAENGGGHNGQLHNGVARSCLAQFIDRSETLSTLLDDPRILGVATSLLGEDFNYMGSDGNYYGAIQAGTPTAGMRKSFISRSPSTWIR